MKKAIYRSFVELSANRLNSYLLKKFTASPLSKPIVKSFAKTYKLNEHEMEKPLEQYQNLQELFTRKLKQGARVTDERPFHVVSPVDGVLASADRISERSEFFIKGQTYSLTEMLGDKTDVGKYCGGYYVILYLSPRHYHRIHSPVSGFVTQQWELGKKSSPVNEAGLKYGNRPLSKNYRFITELTSAETKKNLCIVKVGALNVNSVHTVHASNQLQKGEEVAYFSFGSTVVLLFEKDMFQLHNTIHCPMEVTVGTSIGLLSQ